MAVTEQAQMPSDDGASSEGSPAGRGRAGRDLPIAIASGLTLAGIFLGSLFWHPAAFTAVVTVLVVIAVIEVGRVLAGLGLGLSVPVVLVASLTMLAGAYRAGPTGQVVGVLVLFLGAVFWQLADAEREGVVRTVANTMLIGLWVGFLASYAILLVLRDQGGDIGTLAVIGGAVFTDIGAYAAGSLFGRHPIAPRVSPKKTWEGLVGGLLTAAILAAIVLPLIGDLFSVVSAVVVAMVVGLAGFLGDLTESMFKRDLGIKDLGALIPGHGGVLDRVDGILLALPVGYYALLVLDALRR